MKTLISSVGVLAVLALGSTASAGAVTKAAYSDQRTDTRIEHRIKADTSLKHDNIDVSVKDHVVTLTGSVASDRERLRAARLAHMKGVTRVDNQLAVDHTAPKGTMGTIEEKTKAGAEATKHGAATAAEK